MKRSFFQAAVVSILLYGCATWTLTKRLEKKVDGNYTRMLRAILNKSLRQHPTRHQLYDHLPPITKTIQAGTSSSVMYSYRPPHMAGQNQDNQFEHTYSSYVRIRDVALKTCQRRWTIGRSGERGSGISVLVARHDDDDDLLLKKTNTFFTFYLFNMPTYVNGSTRTIKKFCNILVTCGTVLHLPIFFLR